MRILIELGLFSIVIMGAIYVFLGLFKDKENDKGDEDVQK